MSFPNFGETGAQPQQPGEEQGAFGAPGAPQQQQMPQQMDPSQQQGQFGGAPQGGPPPGSAGPQSGGDQKTTLWYDPHMHDLGDYREVNNEEQVADTSLLRMGELEPWIDENFVRSVWFGMGYQVNVKMIRDKFSG